MSSTVAIEKSISFEKPSGPLPTNLLLIKSGKQQSPERHDEDSLLTNPSITKRQLNIKDVCSAEQLARTTTRQHLTNGTRTSNQTQEN